EPQGRTLERGRVCRDRDGGSGLRHRTAGRTVTWTRSGLEGDGGLGFEQGGEHLFGWEAEFGLLGVVRKHAKLRIWTLQKDSWGSGRGPALVGCQARTATPRSRSRRIPRPRALCESLPGGG